MTALPKKPLDARRSSGLRLQHLGEEFSGASGLHASTRDASVDLSDSSPEPHQHWWPAGANCCQSLLLDSDATIGVDLRKRLFLLVSGRGE
jgi:hypothetical protein